MRRTKTIAAAAAVLLGLASAPATGSTDAPGGIPSPQHVRAGHAIHWRHSKPLGEPWDGRLERGVRLPRGGPNYFTWYPVERRVPNLDWRRWGTDRLLHRLLRVIRGYHADHPSAPRIGVGDISRPHGGDFGPEFGGLGHVSHQNGLDVDVYYPRTDRRERAPRVPEQVDHRLAQDLVDGFVAAGAERVFVGPNVDLHGPAGVVQVLEHHDDHLHFRIPGYIP
jgi:murein endopeptidase